jgi:hypothetical protein
MAPLLTAHQSEQLFGRGSPRPLGNRPPLPREERLVPTRRKGSWRIEFLVQAPSYSAVKEDRS